MRANPRGRNSELPNVYDVVPLCADLHYHHEMTYKYHWVKSLGLASTQ